MSLYGKLVADLTADFKHQIDALHQHPDLVNRFGEAIKPFGLTAAVKPGANGGVSLCAVHARGADATALQESMRAAGYHIGEAVQPSHQFNDGFLMWVAPVRGANLEFSLLFYTAADAAENGEANG
jgi:hypothetical protein